MGNKTDKKMLKGAAVIGIAGILVKVIGAFFRIPVNNWLGASAVSYYSAAYTIYSALLVIATAGLPVAISRMVSEEIAQKKYKNAHKVFKISLYVLTGIGVVLFSLCFFGSDIITGLMKNPNASLAVKAIAPALLFVPAMSAFRGYFQGRQNMNPTAISEIIEQLIRVGFGLVLTYILLSVGEPEAAAGASSGASFGSVAGLIVIFLIYVANKKAIAHKIKNNDKEVSPTGDIVKKLLVISIPICIGSAIMPIMSVADMAIVMRRLLASGWTQIEAQTLYGLISSYCGTLIGFPQIFIVAVAISLVPAISHACAIKDRENMQDNTALGYRLTTIMAFPCAAGIFALAKPILLLMYPARPEEAIMASSTLMIMGLGIIPLALSQTSTGVLQAVDRQNVPVKNILIGMVAKLAASFLLVGIRPLNIKGAAIGTFLAYAISFILNNKEVIRVTGTRFDFETVYFKPALASLIMGACAFGAYFGLSRILLDSVSTLIAVFLGVVIYAVLVILFKIIAPEDLESIPRGATLNRLIRKVVKNW